jgi:Cation transporter/ATPase, N-terminus
MSASDVAGSASPTVAEILAKLGTDRKTGLNPGQLQERLNKFGPNAAARRKENHALSVPRCRSRRNRATTHTQAPSLKRGKWSQ